MSIPTFQVGSTIYLRESANIGALESYQVVEVRQDGSGVWYYKIAVAQRPPTSNATYGDRITLRTKPYDIEFGESELCTYCEAINLALIAAQSQLTRLQALHAAYCSGESGSN